MRKEIELITQMTDSAATVVRRDDYVRLQSLFDSLDGVVPELAGIFCPENRADAVLITLLLVRRRFPFVHLTNVDEPNSCNIIACSASSENNQELRSKYPEYMGRILGTNIIFLRRPGRRRIFFEGGYYVMRTSGTTSVSGREVTVPLRNLISDVDSIKEKLGIRSLVTGILLSPFTFDPSLVEIMVPLSCPSGTLIIPQVSVVQAPNLLYDVIVAKKVSLLMMTPTLWMRFTESQRLSLMFNPVVHDLILGGEPFPSEFLHEIYRRLTGKNHYLHLARMWNIYGTTESSVWATLGQIPPPVYKALQNRWEWPEFDRLVHEGIPIGSPLNGKELFISFDTSNLVAEGDFSSHKGREGELWIGGDCRCCLVEGETEPMKIRPTGDLIKVNDSGDILIVGRVDEVFKRNGLRIIPHAVAAVLKDSIGYLVKDCICFPFKNDDKKSGELIAALKTSYCDYSREYFLVQLKSAVINQKVLPPLAVPKEFFILDQWMTPMTPHGKLDKQRLLSELIKRSSHRIELADVIFHQADVTLVEVSSWSKRIHALYSAILHDGSMPLKDNSNLLAEGGTSIDATLIAVKLESILRMEYENLPADICERLTSHILHKSLNEVVELVQNSISLTASSTLCAPKQNESNSMFERLWEIDMKQCVDAAPVLDGQNTAYIGSHSGKVCAINVMNGEELWSISLPNRVEACCALNSGESWLAVGCHDGFLYVLDCPTGIQLSKFKTRGEIKSAAVLNGADIWFGSYDHSIYCVWYGNGKCKEKFRFYVGQNIFAKPLLHEGYVIFAGTKGDVICIDAAKHCLKWHQKVDTKAFFSSPVAAADAIVIIGIYGTVYRIHLESGSTLWYSMPNVSSPVFSSPIIIERHMIAIHGSNDGSLYYIDMMENSRHKLLSLPQAVFASPAVMRLPRCKKIFVAICCVDGSVYIAELLRNGEAKIIGSYSMSESQIFSSPVAKQDGESTFRLIFGCRNSDKVVCVRVRLG